MKPDPTAPTIVDDTAAQTPADDTATLPPAPTGSVSTTRVPAVGARFCPLRGVNPGATQRLEGQTTRLLQARLSALALLCAIPSALAALRFALVDQPGILGSLLITVVGGLCWLVLRGPNLEQRSLRGVGFALYLGALAGISLNAYTVLGHALAAGEFGVYQANANRLPGVYLLLMVGYAMLIPSRWRHTALVMLCIVAGSLVAPLALMWTHAEAFAAAGDSIDRLDQVSFGLMMMVVGAGFAVYGSHLINGYRRSVAEADDAGMYQLVGKLGEGGMGEVWQAEHRMLARPAAIKIIREDLPGGGHHAGTATERFTREARATARLQSPHTVQLYDFGTTHDGTFFYVMEMLRGMDMEDLVQRYGPVPPERAVFLLCQAADSLGEAHARGLVHRDVKPGNLHVGVVAGVADWVKVLDFGLVKSFADDAQQQTALTMEGVTTGTPAYFPPEMAGGAAAADVRSDVYALSAVAYWLVTGELVFEGGTPLEMVLQHVKDDPVPPSQRADNPIPAALDAAILRGLSKRPEDRPQTMAELAGLLQAAVAGQWDRGDAEQWWRLNEPELITGVA